jgi:hypothetical protein
MNSTSLPDHLFCGKHPDKVNFNDRDQRAANDEWIGNVVIYKLDKNCYPVVTLRFDHSAQTLPVEGLNITHAEYFRDRKKINLEYPNRKCSHLVNALLIN